MQLLAILLAVAAFACRSSSRSTAARTIDSVAVGTYNACSRHTDGSVTCWGRCGVACNGPGKPPPGGDTASGDPEPVHGLGEVTSLALGDSFGCGSRRDGSVWCWGSNWDGVFGAAQPERSTAPVRVAGASDIVELRATSSSMVCGRRRDGTVLAWGGTLSGVDRTPENQAKQAPTPIAGIAHADALFTTGGQCCAHEAGDGLRCFSSGVGQRGANGQDDWSFSYSEARPTDPPNARAVGDCGCTLDGEGTLSCASLAMPGAMPSNGEPPPPPRNGCSIDRLEHVVSWATWNQYGCAVLASGRVVCWGTLEPQYGAYDGKPPHEMAIDAPARQVAIGLFGTAFVVDQRGRLWAWGHNTEHAIFGQAAANVDQPVLIDSAGAR